MLEHLILQYRRSWRGSLLSTFLLPVLVLFGLGISIGKYVDDGRTQGIPYVAFIAPGLLASSALQLAVSESTWPVLSAFEWRRMYFAMQASPLRPGDIVGGQQLYIQLRVIASSLCFLVVMALFGTLHSAFAALAVGVTGLLTASASLPVMAFAATVSTDYMFLLILRLVVIPMTLFSGVFFPVSVLPPVPRWLAYASPLWHAVELCRSATLGRPGAGAPALHVFYLAVWAVTGYVLARRQFARRLQGGRR